MLERTLLLLFLAVSSCVFLAAADTGVASITCTEKATCKDNATRCDEQEVKVECPVTCKACDLKLNCRDDLSSDKCDAYFRKGYCHMDPRRMAASCQKTCLFCQGPSSCPKGWVEKDLYCFYVSKKPKTFDDADQECKRHRIGAALVSITSAEEQERLAQMIQKTGIKESWTGLFVNNYERMQFTDNTQFTKDSFHLFPKNGMKLKSGFGVVSNFQKKVWSFERLTQKKPFICASLPTGFCRNKCGKNAVCKFLTIDKKPQYVCRCKDGYYGDPVKGCEEPCVCQFNGDPHYQTFDLGDIHFMGRCTYHLARTIKDLQIKKGCEFDVHVRNEDRRPATVQYRELDISWTKYVEIHFREKRYRFMKGNKLMVNGVLVKTAEFVSIVEEQLTFTAPDECGHIKVSFDGDQNGIVSIDRTRYTDKVEGLCADCNGDAGDDYVTRNGVDLRDDKKRDAKIGNSWRVRKLSAEEKDEKACDSELTIFPTCNIMQTMNGHKICGVFTSTTHPLFKSCHQYLAAIGDGCYWDYCANSTLLVKRLCSYYAAAATICRKHGVRMEKWRQILKCPMKCPPNSYYTYDAPRAESHCKQSAHQNNFLDNKAGREGCVCKDGYMRLGAKCVKNCGCVAEDGDLKEIGDTWITKDCTKKYTCKSWNKTTVVTQKCGTGAECSVVNGVRDCHCKPGYSGNPFKKCRDIDECKKSPCGRNSECKNSEGSYKCTCDSGYVPDKSKKSFTCINEDECDRDVCPQNSTCTDTIGSYSCTCDTGFKMSPDKKKCIKLIQCDQAKCTADHSYCKNLKAGGYECVCDEGFVDADKGKDKHNPNCVDINECLKVKCKRIEKCVNTEGSYRCDCKKGKRVKGKCIPFTCDDVGTEQHCGRNTHCGMTSGGDLSCECKEGFVKNKDGKKVRISCRPIDHCKNNTCVKFSSCVTSSNGYTCVCNKGYRGDGKKKCEPENPCTKNPNLCGENAICKFGGRPNAYTCICKKGFKKTKGGKCVNINECHLKIDNCDRKLSVCKDLVPESDSDAGFFCECKDGTRMIGNSTQCVDINECDDKECRNPCGENEVCENLKPGYRCKCKKGFVLMKEQCVNVNECAEKNPCTTSMLCIDTQGSYACTCKAGFKLNAKKTSCIDIDECKRKNKCSKNAVCTNNAGYYSCKCKKGFAGDGFVCHKENVDCDEKTKKCSCADGYRKVKNECVNINECIDKVVKHKCHENATCEDTGGSYVCHCKTGFCGTGYDCTDNDECVANKHNCHAKATCINTPGSFSCTCKAGYYGDGVHCDDIDECKSNVHGCINALCVNSKGGYSCQCLPGFRPSGKSTRECVNINECVARPGICGKNAKCHDTPGAYRCVCNPGYTRKNKQCVDEDECLERPCGKFAECTNTVGSYECNCLAGFRKRGKKCTNIDECKEKSPCHEHAVCTDNKGSYDCKCRSGFEGDGKKMCKDIDECKLKKKVCDKNANCRNTVGGYECSCKSPHWIGSGVLPHKCKHNEINECKKENICQDNQICKDLDFGYKCVCKAGYVVSKINKNLCEDRDECEDKSAKYPEHAVCHNTIGSYEWSCEDGFKKLKGKCVDLDECKAGKHRCIEEVSVCNNTVGGYQCDCNTGYERDGSMFECRDTDECEDKPCKGPHTTCLNIPGSYRCTCDMGYFQAGNGCKPLVYVMKTLTPPPKKPKVTYSPYK